MEKLKSIVDGAMDDLADTLSDEQTKKVGDVIQAAVIRGLLEGQHRAVDACRNFSGAEQEVATEIATAIRQKNDVLITNLSSLR